nr:EOG090X0IQO [Polyphemus pediculus]
MPLYELALTIKNLSKPELVSTLKRTAETILQHGGVLRQFQSMGHSPLPYRIKAHNVMHKEGNYFVMKFDAPTSSVSSMSDAFKRDIDIVKQIVFKQEQQSTFECTLDEEMKPPAYRKDVEKLVEEGRVIKRPMYNQNTPGINYYPFQK